jgi:hypothetical protein
MAGEKIRRAAAEAGFGADQIEGAFRHRGADPATYRGLTPAVCREMLDSLAGRAATVKRAEETLRAAGDLPLPAETVEAMRELAAERQAEACAAAVWERLLAYGYAEGDIERHLGPRDRFHKVCVDGATPEPFVQGFLVWARGNAVPAPTLEAELREAAAGGVLSEEAIREWLKLPEQVLRGRIETLRKRRARRPA